MAQELFKVVITAIVVRDGKFLIMQRSPKEKKFPGRWTVPGGKLDTSDYTNFLKDTPHYWYNVLERTLKREVKEEAGIEIANIRYVTSLASAPLETTNFHPEPSGQGILERLLRSLGLRRVSNRASADPDKPPSLVVSCLADYASGDVVLSDEMQNFAWVTLKEARGFDLIEGIWEELVMADRMARGGERGEWG